MRRSEKFKISLVAIKAICGVAGGALVLTENHPYITLIILSIGAAANEVQAYLKNQMK